MDTIKIGDVVKHRYRKNVYFLIEAGRSSATWHLQQVKIGQNGSFERIAKFKGYTMSKNATADLTLVKAQGLPQRNAVETKESKADNLFAAYKKAKTSEEKESIRLQLMDVL